MDFSGKKFQQRCMLMLSVLLLWVVINFVINTAATLKRNTIREEVTAAHVRIEGKLDRLEKKIDQLNTKK